jgi:exosortase
MNPASASSQLPAHKAIVPASLCAAFGAALFYFFGNATRGYIHTPSLFTWWWAQWFDPGSETQHGALIAAVALWLLWRNLRQPDFDRPAGPCLRMASLAMLGGLVLHLAGFALQQTRLSIVAALIFFWGVLALGGGRRIARAALFPFGFMLLSVPVSFIDTLGFNLRLAVAQNVAFFADKLGLALARSGTQLSSPDGHLQYDVAAACSGIRSLVALIALSLLVGYLWLRSWFPRVALAAACLPFVVIGNIVRVLFIVIAADKFGQDTAGTVHTVSGYLNFAVVFALLLGMVALLRRVGFGKRQEPSTPDDSIPQPAAGSPWRIAFLSAAACAVVALAAVLLDRMQQRHFAGVRLTADASSPVELPSFIGTNWIGRRVDVSALEREVLPPDTGYSRKNYIRVAAVGQQVFFSVVLSGRDRTSIHRPELCLTGQGWTINSRSHYEFSTPAGPVQATLLRVEHPARTAAGENIVVQSAFAYWFVGSSSLESSHLGMQWRDVVDRIRHLRSDRWAYVVVQALIMNNDEAETLSRMQEVVAGVWPQLAAAAPAE